MRLLWAAALVLPALGAQAAAVLTTLYSFTDTNDGANPNAGLAEGSDGNFYGTTVLGGRNGVGTVFKISTNGVLTTLHIFGGGNDGCYPYAGLVEGSDGNFYGTTQEIIGGAGVFVPAVGTVFKISTNGALTSLCSFNLSDGAYPEAGLVQGSDGNFYGTTESGGTSWAGTVFQITTNGVLNSLYSFTGGDDGANPWAGLAQGSDGNFYGTTSSGGSNQLGTVFKISTNGALTGLHSFSGSDDGGWPQAGLVQGSDGNFYGTAALGGRNGNGTVFKISTNGVLARLHSFTGGNDGANPYAGLVQGSDGSFYGTTCGGGTNGGYGTVFKITTNGVLTSLYSFTGGSDGAQPYAGLVQGSDGNFYGTTWGGGVGGSGTVFRLTIVPAFQAVTLTNGMLSLGWSTEAGARYQLQCNSDLSSGNWTNLGSPFAGTGGTFRTTDSVTNGPQRFYRVTVLP
jgi:uncharacterized repeat protein (TIGR03803 family)